MPLPLLGLATGIGKTLLGGAKKTGTVVKSGAKKTFISSTSFSDPYKKLFDLEQQAHQNFDKYV